MTKSLPQAPGRRAVLAFIALADAPMPEEISFRVHPDPKIGHCLDLKLDSGADLLIWSEFLGCDQRWNRRHLNTNGNTWINTGHLSASGWVVALTAYDDAQPTTALDDDTREQLEQLVPQQRDGSGS